MRGRNFSYSRKIPPMLTTTQVDDVDLLAVLLGYDEGSN
jgi:hypothetical protein